MSTVKRPEKASSLRALQLSEARWEALVAAAPDAIVGIDAEGHITLFNPTAERMFGYPASEIHGQNVNKLMPAPYASEHDDYIRNYRKTGVPQAIGRIRQVQARRKNGEVFPIELSVSEARVGEEVRYTAIIRDISEREHLQSALQRRERQLSTLIGNLPGFVYRCHNDPEWTMEFVSNGVRDILGVEPGDLIANRKTYGSHIHPDDADRVHEQVQRSLDAGGVFETTYRVRTSHGAERWVWERGRFVDEEHIEGFVTDITEREQTAAKLRELEEAKRQNERLAEIGEISAKIVHDIGNPLAGLSLQSELILRRSDDERIRKPAERVLDTVHRLDGMVREFMNFSREQRLQLSEIDVGDFIREVADNWELVAKEHEIPLQIVAAQAPVTIRGDKAKLRRVLDNLIKNAIESIESKSGRIVLRFSLPESEKVRLTVEDTGSGIPVGMDVFRLFETTKGGGNGLGLAVARQIVIAHGGSMDHQPGEPTGTIFNISLPQGGPTVGGTHGRDRR